MKPQRIATAFSTLAITCLASVAAQAASVSVDWTGTVTDPAGFSGVAAGDAITGSFAYDSGAPPLTTLPVAAVGYDTQHVSSFTLGTRSGSLANQSISVFDDFRAGDQFDSRRGPTGTVQTYTGDTFDGLAPESLFVASTDPSGTVFNSTQLPDTLSSAGFLFPSIGSNLGFDGGRDILFEVTSFTSEATTAPIPVAPSLPLLASGLVVFGAWRARGRAAPG